MGLSRSWLIIIIMLFMLHFLQNSATLCNKQYEGDTCTRDGKQGICTRLAQCPSIYKNMLIRQFPHCACGYIHFEPVVCCQKESKSTLRNSSVYNPYRINHGAKAKAKCQEYGSMPLQPINTSTSNITITNNGTWPILLRKLITNGVKTMDKEFKFMAAIGYGSIKNDISWQCGGTLISERFVVTAAHCIYNVNWGSATWVRLGTNKLSDSNNNKNAKTYRIIERIRHPQYKQPSYYHDIALLKLEVDVEFTLWISPCCLPYSLLDVGSNGRATAMGWGHTEWAGEGSNELLKITIDLISHSECNKVYSSSGKDDKLEFGVVDNWQICAGGDGKDTCQGDSGGPLVTPNKDYNSKYTLIGVTSLGKFCGSIIPSIYTNVYNYISWIENIVWPDP